MITTLTRVHMAHALQLRVTSVVITIYDFILSNVRLRKYDIYWTFQLVPN